MGKTGRTRGHGFDSHDRRMRGSRLAHSQISKAASDIGDQDGLDEQAHVRDWQMAVMV